MRKEPGRLLAAALLVLAGSVGARADGTGQCIKDAKNTYTECKTQCKGDFDDARALCRNVSPGCFEACVDGRAECVDTARQPLETCLDGCQTTLAGHRSDCKAGCGCGGNTGVPCNSNACFVSCMDPFQLDAFKCRDDCRDQFRLDVNARAALKACQTGFKSCVKSCPPPTP